MLKMEWECDVSTRRQMLVEGMKSTQAGSELDSDSESQSLSWFTVVIQNMEIAERKFYAYV